MPPEPGPLNNFPFFNQSLVPGDQGAGIVGFVRVPGKRQFIMNFGTMVSFILLTPDQAQQLLQAFRDEVTKAFGKLPYNKADLPIRVTTFSAGLRLDFPTAVEILIANPEMWLALAEVMETKLKLVRQ